MKILLTGQVGIGKSTTMSRVKKAIESKRNTYSITSHEILDGQGERIGFEAENSDGKRQIFAHKYLIESPYEIAGFKVDVSAIDVLVVGEIEKALADPASLVLIDEIGRMQFFSPRFIDALVKIFEGENPVLATIVQDPEPWSLPYKNDPNNVLIDIDAENREVIPEPLINPFTNLDLIKALSPNSQAVLRKLAREYGITRSITQFRKLFNNALFYAAGRNCEIVGQDFTSKTFSIKGNHESHEVTLQYNNGKTLLSCSCDLFHGRAIYEGRAGECSHIQTVKLLGQDQQS